MTFRLSSIAAVLLLSSTSALAGDVSSDSARARADLVAHAGHHAPAATEARVPASTDQARALAAAGSAVEPRPGGHMAASARSCACHHG